jgi:ABC-type glucose/galactose transport system permease subunit
MPFTGKLKIAEAILIMQAITIIITAVFISDLNYSRQVNQANSRTLLALTNETAQLIEQQGNISNTQRAQLLHAIITANMHGGIATTEHQAQLNETIQQLDDKLDRLLNATNVTKH